MVCEAVTLLLPESGSDLARAAHFASSIPAQFVERVSAALPSPLLRSQQTARNAGRCRRTATCGPLRSNSLHHAVEDTPLEPFGARPGLRG
jgi:hypothetical protein